MALGLCSSGSVYLQLHRTGQINFHADSSELSLGKALMYGKWRLHSIIHYFNPPGHL
jgi:hypothetical protein